MLEWFNR